jgi:hypothetical protein
MTLPYGLRLKLTREHAAGALVTLAPLIYFLPALRGSLVISPDDGVIQNIPLRVAASLVVRGGNLPLWNPYIFGGMPLHGAAQAGLLFPLNWFYLLFSTPVATNLMMLSTYSFAALGAYVYARRSGTNIAGSILTSLAWQWSAFMVCQIGHTNIVQTAACLPWILWAVDGYGLTGRRWRGVLLSALIALQVFVGHPQTLVYSLLLVTAYALIMACGSKEMRGAFRRSLIFIGAGVLLAAVQIVPTFELMRNSLRATASYEFFTSFSMPRRFVLTLFAPFLNGGGDGQLFRARYVGPPFFAEYTAYVGLAALMLAVLAIVLRRDARTKFWAAVVVVCLLLALGEYAPLGFYRLVYFVPLLNLFRVPARHLMEVEFALAVLAGRGLTVLAERRADAKTLRRVLVVGAGVVLLTWLVVTSGRPADFHLGREAPVSLLRAPELFLPIVFAILGASALWFFARGRKPGAALLLLFAVIILDSFVWGQSNGWRTASPKFDSGLWREPATVTFLHDREVSGEPYRILTEDQPFDPSQPVPPKSSGGPWVPELQPDIYMMFKIENAAGYEGFGLSRYSRLAGEMKVWGEFTDPETTLRGESRELDLLNVRYLFTRPINTAGATDANSASAGARPESLAASESYGGQKFAAGDLGLPSVASDTRITFSVPPVDADHIALLTNLAWAVDVPDGAVVARVRLHTDDGKTFDVELRAGEHTSEWAHDRADIRARIKHKRAPVATSYDVADAQGNYQGHTYVASLALPKRAVVTGGEISIAAPAQAPGLMLFVKSLSLVDAAKGQVFPLRREWVKREPSANPTPALASQSSNLSKQSPKKLETKVSSAPSERWRRLAPIGDVAVFENLRVLPRVWLASSAQALSDDQILSVIRSGRLPDGNVWDPRRLALVESPLDFPASDSEDATARAEITRHDPNRVEVKTAAQGARILVLSANHYPGWLTYVDGSKVETLRVDYNLRGVPLPAGEHRVEFVYRPKSVLGGLAISIFVLVVLVLWSRRVLPEETIRRFARNVFNRKLETAER